MKFFASICLSLVVCQLGTSFKIQKKEPEDDVRYNSNLKPITAFQSNSSILTSCNGVLNAASGGIAYKAFEPISENERCVWTIRAGIVKGFTLNVLNIGISNSTTDTQVIASCLRHQAGPTHFLLNQTGPVDGVAGCDVLMITLASGTDVGNSSGFVLEYSVLRNSTLSPVSKDYILNAEEPTIIRYPSPALEYTNFEFTTFAILPNLGSKTNVIYFRNSLEGTTCLDNLRIFRFNASSEVPTKWQYDGLICGQIPSDMITNDDLILITFNSDISRVGTGFELAVVTSAASDCQF